MLISLLKSSNISLLVDLLTYFNFNWVNLENYDYNVTIYKWIEDVIV